MYTAYYGFREKPFALSPDPRFLYLSGSHREVLGHLVYGIEQGEGFMAITGEVGTGKTTLCRTLLRRLGSESEVAFLFNPTLTPLELLKAINTEFGLSTFGESRPELTDVLNGFLLEQSGRGRRVLLIVDEAQNLATDTLEQLRLLSNLETETRKLIQIVLLGQPELDAKLDANELRQLRQRISVWWHLGSLDAHETYEYVRHRLRIAGALERPIFDDAALRTVHQLSRGVPRLINLICDRALLAGYAEQEAQIGRKLVLRAAEELRPRRRRRFGRRVWLGASLGAVAVALAGGLAARIALAPDPEPVASPSVAAAPAPAPPTAATAARAPTESAAAPMGMEAFLASVPRAEPESRPLLTGVLDSLLTLSLPAESRATTLDAALAAWAMPPSGARLLAEPELRDRLASRRLELLPVLPELSQLRAASMPVIVSLRDADGVARLALLRRLSEDSADLEGLVRGRTVRVSTSDLLRHLDGEVLALWRDFEDLPPVIRQGDAGRAVVWLQDALAQLGYFDEAIDGRFDTPTRDAVTRFQLDRSIDPDGAVGPQTQMRLYGALPGYETPQLSAEPVNLAHSS